MFKAKLNHGHEIFLKLCLIIILISIIILSSIFVYRLRNQYFAELDRALLSQKANDEAVSKTYKYVKLPGGNKPLAIYPFQYNSETGLLRLVNKSNSVGPGYSPKNLQPVTIPYFLAGGPIMVRPEVNEALTKINIAAQKDGVYLMVRSGYRSFDLQNKISLASYADDMVAPAGQSEHQTGLAVDFNSTPADCINNCALDAKTAQWLADNAPQYGFILRYPASKQSVTGYPGESWHFRYVGVPMAQAIANSGLAFDEAYSYISN